MNYIEIVKNVLENGIEKTDRTGVGTISLFGERFFHDMRTGFPAVTEKKLFWDPMIGELLWFIEGSTNVERLREITWGKGSDKGTIWDLNYENQGKALGYSNGDLGPVYGAQWRDFGKSGNMPPYFTKGVDQLVEVIDTIKNNPDSRRLLVSAWNPSDLNKMALPPCHYAFQFNILGDYIDLMWNQRSVDVFLGLPFNIASYAVLLEIVAHITGYTPRHLIGSLGDTHIYSNHVDAAKEMIGREPRKLPFLGLPEFTNCFYSMETKDQLNDIVLIGASSYELLGYDPHPAIKAPMAV